jgi:acid phosphatase
VILVVEENHSFSQIIGSPKAPFLNRLAGCGMLLTNYLAPDHPSLPNYIRLLSGDDQGVRSDAFQRSLTAPNLVDQLEQAGISWKAYMEDLPQPCWRGPGTGPYVKRHNPFMYFDSIHSSSQRCGNIVPFDEFATDLAADRVPRFVFITPDLTHDMHGLDKSDDRRWPLKFGRSGRLISAGDLWLEAQVYRPLLGSSAWARGTRVIVTFDEASRFAPKGLGLDRRVATIINGPDVLPGRDPARYSHYALLRSIEGLFQLPYLARASKANSIPALAR